MEAIIDHRDGKTSSVKQLGMFQGAIIDIPVNGQPRLILTNGGKSRTFNINEMKVVLTDIEEFTPEYLDPEKLAAGL